jgi:hypothetical protein
MWSVASGEKLFQAERPFNGPAMAVSWASHDTSRFVVGYANGDLHLFWSENRKVMKKKLLQGFFNLISTLNSRTVIISAYREGTGLLKVSCTTQIMTGSLASVRNRHNCEESKGPSWFRFSDRHLSLKDMGNVFISATTEQALSCTI